MKYGKERLLVTSFTNRIESELKTPSVVMVYAALPRHFFQLHFCGVGW